MGAADGEAQIKMQIMFTNRSPEERAVVAIEEEEVDIAMTSKEKRWTQTMHILVTIPWIDQKGLHKIVKISRMSSSRVLAVVHEVVVILFNVEEVLEDEVETLGSKSAEDLTIRRTKLPESRLLGHSDELLICCF